MQFSEQMHWRIDDAGVAAEANNDARASKVVY